MKRELTVESIHVTLGLGMFYITLLRLIYKTLNPTPRLQNSLFPGQKNYCKTKSYIFICFDYNYNYIWCFEKTIQWRRA